MDAAVVVDKVPLGFYFLAAFAGLMASIGDSFLNIWAKVLPAGTPTWVPQWMSLAGGFVFWNISLVIFILMLKRGFLAQSIVMFITANCVFGLLMSQFMFHEVLSTIQWIAIALAIGAVVMMELG